MRFAMYFILNVNVLKQRCILNTISARTRRTRNVYKLSSVYCVWQNIIIFNALFSHFCVFECLISDLPTSNNHWFQVKKHVVLPKCCRCLM
jgi:hypothetical protein